MLRLLIIEDDDSAAELTLRSLSAAGLSCDVERVGSEVEFRSALTRTPDLILSDSIESLTRFVVKTFNRRGHLDPPS